MNRRPYYSNGFTIVELLVAMGIMVLLLGLTSINFIRPQQKANVEGTMDSLVSDLRTQQANAMSGKSDSAYGVRIEPTRYILFRGASYVAGDSANVIVTAPGNTLSTSFVSSVIVFTKLTGEVAGFTSGTNQVTITSGTQTKTLNLNRYGIPTIL